MRNSHLSRTLLALSYVPLVAAFTLAPEAASAGPAVVPRPQVIDTGVRVAQVPLPSNSYCLQNFGEGCVTPAMLANAYNFRPLRAACLPFIGPALAQGSIEAFHRGSSRH